MTHPGYPEWWYEAVAKATGDDLRVQKLEAEKAREEESKAKARQMAERVLALLEARGIEVDDAGREKILETEDVKQAKEWLVRAATAESVEDVLE